MAADTESFRQVLDLKRALDAHAIVAITDAQGRITYVNDKFCAISQYNREELMGQDHRLINSDLHSRQFMQHLWSTIRRGETWRGEIRNRAKDGTFYWVDTSIVPFLDKHGKPQQYVSVRTDITMRKQLELSVEQLNRELEGRVKERTEQLEAANQELEAFSYSVSHDLRAPLRAINGFAEMLNTAAGHRLDASSKHYLARIRAGGIQLGNLIDDLLLFARLGRQALHMRLIDSNVLVASVLEEAAPLVTERSLDLRVEDLLPCWGDWPLLRQVWVNLISNAIKYTRTRENTKVTIGSTVSAGRVTYFVKDNGVGFNMRYADKLFGVFQRLHPVDQFEGTGVGLAIAHRIISKHRGKIWAEGAEGLGATFYFTIDAYERK